MENTNADYPVSAKEVSLILTAGAHVALKREEYEVAGAIFAIRKRVMELPEWGLQEDDAE